MRKVNDLPEDDEERPEPAELKRVRELHQAYRDRFGEWAPRFGVPYTNEAEELEAIEQALKTGRPIEDQTPPGCVS
jgi:hypothetical protein